MLGKLTASSCIIWCVFTLTSQGVAQDRIPRIINGDPTAEFESVGIVGSLHRGEFCTGTLISPFHVLTAAHCAEIIAASDQATFEVGGQVYVAATVLIHPEYDSRNLANDLAILELADPVTDIMPTELLRSSPAVGDILTLVGFGAGGDAQGSDGTFGIKQVSTTPIDELTPTEVIWRFDNADEGNSAAGDSGGPGLLDIDGVYYLAAIVSSGTDPASALGDIAFNMRVDAYVDWMDAVVGTFDPGENPDEEPSDERPTDEEPTGETPSDEQPSDEEPSDEEPTGETPGGCKVESGNYFNWPPPLAHKPSRGQQFRRPSRRPWRHTPSRVTGQVGPPHRVVASIRRVSVSTAGRRGLSSRSPRRSR